MPLQPGQRLAHYEVHEKIGAGGMGEVYRATDTRLSRDVAIKALPDDVARDPERLARFRREAQLLAALNHPNIAAIHGLEEDEEKVFLALELVPGHDLSARIKEGPLPFPEAVGLALQIAEALEDAHEQGIVHRDLKPANIKVTPLGKVKILDFGLAKALEPVPGDGGSASLSPTMTAAATRAGIILGTAAYMSPEQARGTQVDRRADIWAFGCVLLEMLSGRNVFSEPTVSDTLASVLKSEPDWDALPRGTSASMRRLLMRCLQKDPKLRLRDIGEARIALKEILSSPQDDAVAVAALPAKATARWGLVAGAIVLTALATWLAVTLTRPEKPEGLLRRIDLVGEGLQVDLHLMPQISPDGRKVVYANDGRLWIREMDRLEPRALPGTEGSSYPFWSPDSASVGYIHGNDLRRIAIEGGASATITPSVGSFNSAAGLAWGEDGRIVYSRGDTGLMEVQAVGGEPRVLLAPAETESDHHQPSQLPDRRGVLFVAHRQATGPDTISVLADGKRKDILSIEKETLFRPIYAPSGHILYRRRGTRAGLWAVPFDLKRLETTGEPFLLEQDADFPSIARDGSLLYVRGATTGLQQLVWISRDGAVEGTMGQPQTRMDSPAISPDGERIAVMAQENENWDIWIHDVTRSTRTRLTFTSAMDWDPAWTADGSRVIFWEGTTRAISWKAADGTGEVERLVDPNLSDSGVPSITSDGSQMVFWARPNQNVDDIWSMPLSGERTPVPLIQSPAREDHPRISPDGSFMAYVSNESGRNEVYLTRFPGGEGKWQVSVTGGTIPRWSPSGDRLFYVELPAANVMEVDVSLTPAVRMSTPRLLFNTKKAEVEMNENTRFDVSRDGKRFLMIKSLRPEGDRPRLVLVDNWMAQIKKPASP